MQFSKKTSWILFFIYFLLLPFNFIKAERKINDNALDFSLAIEAHTSSLKLPNQIIEAKSDILGISWYEPFTEYFHGGLEVGYINMTQADNSLVSAKYSSGQYAGLLLRFIPLTSNGLSLILNMNYRMNKTEAKETNQSTEFTWQEALFSAEIKYHPSPKFAISLIAQYNRLTGEQNDSGTVTQSRDFSETEQTGYRSGVEYLLSPGSIVGIGVHSGYKEGTSIYFKRTF